MNKIIVIALALTLNAAAHDEGHGPKLSDAPKQGGVLTSAVLAKEAGLGPKAELVYKAEIVRTGTGGVSVYFYDKTMTPLKLDAFAKSAKGVLITAKKGKETIQNFELRLAGDHFAGQAPKPARKPYNIDVKVSDGNREVLAAFDNLD